MKEKLQNNFNTEQGQKTRSEENAEARARIKRHRNNR